MIAIVLGTRAELIKMFPIMRELKRVGKEYKFIHTGQHKLDGLCKTFGVKKPDIILSKQPEKSSKFFSNSFKAIFWNLFMIFKLRKTLRGINGLKYVLYHGDTMTTASAAIASSRLLNLFKKYKNVHVEAGLRSGSIFEPFPEELSRKISDSFSDINFSPSELAGNNIKNSVVVGNTILDSVNYVLNLKKIKMPEKDYVVCTLHRHENISSKENLTKVVEILGLTKTKVILFLHDNTKKQLIKFGLYSKLKKIPKLKILSNLSYMEFIHYLKNCKYILTDGGSIQEESLIFKKPCLLLRNRTERPEGLKTGINFISGLDVTYSKKVIKTIENGELKKISFENPYGKKGVSKEIVGLLE